MFLCLTQTGVDGKDENRDDLEECPICFLFYCELNRSICCHKGICTECFLQIKKPSGQASCPFCNRAGYSVIYSGPLSKEEKQKELEEQQRVIELKIKMKREEQELENKRKEEKSRFSSSLPTLPTLTSTSTSTTSTTNSPSNTETRLSTSYPGDQSHILRFKEAKTDLELEEMMLMEAIRLSLLSNSSSTTTTTTVISPLQHHQSADVDSNSTSSTCTTPPPQALTPYFHESLDDYRFEEEEEDDDELRRAIELSLSLGSNMFKENT